jgi:hypothetical protein
MFFKIHGPSSHQKWPAGPLDQSASKQTQIQAAATAEGKKIESIVVCIIQGATVLTSRRRKLNSDVLDFLAPEISQKISKKSLESRAMF